MRRLIFLLLALPFLDIGKDADGQIDKFGMSLGYNHSNQTWSGGEVYPSKNFSGFSASLIGEQYLLSFLSARLSMGYQNSSLGYSTANASNSTSFNTETLHLHQLSTELVFKGYFSGYRNRPYLLVGAKMNHTFKQKLDSRYLSSFEPTYSMQNNQLNNLQVAVVGGLGFEINNRYFFEANYARGLNPVFEWGNHTGYMQTIHLKFGINFIKPGVCRSKHLGLISLY
ncbi:MAG: outer membrane beta-barrel protein [Bacteroidetes bacterium]|nr:outer membrane beta-barrel protein [Bacteroidota bacterium]